MARVLSAAAQMRLEIRLQAEMAKLAEFRARIRGQAPDLSDDQLDAVANTARMLNNQPQPAHLTPAADVYIAGIRAEYEARQRSDPSIP